MKFSNFDRVPPRPLEIFGRQNWAKVSNLAHFAQKTTKKTTNVEKWCFLTILKKWKFLKFLTHNSQIAKIWFWPRSCPTSKFFWFSENLHKKVFFYGCATMGYYIFTPTASFPQNFARKLPHFFIHVSCSKAQNGQNNGKQTKIFIFF